MSIRFERFTDTQRTLVPKTQTHDFPHVQKAFETSFDTVLQLLAQERSANPLYDHVWKEASKLFQKKEALLTRKSNRIRKECHIAIIAYTSNISIDQSDLKLYQDFNSHCRELEEHKSWRRFPYKSLYCLLAQSIPGVESVPETNRVLYRGMPFHYKESDFTADFILYNFNQVSSFSANVQVAKHFKGVRGTMFVFEYQPMAAYGIQRYSLYPSEDEVLVFPWSTFTIDRVDRSNPDEHVIFLVSEGPFFPGLPYTCEKQQPKSGCEIS